MLKSAFLVFAILSLSQLHAQLVRGTVFCKKDSASLVPFPTIFVLNSYDSTVVTTQVADIDGNYKIKFPTVQSDYLIYIHHYGFRPYFSSKLKSQPEGKILLMNHFLEEELLPEVEILYNKKGVIDISTQNSYCAVLDSKTLRFAADSITEKITVLIPEGCETFYIDNRCYAYNSKEGWKLWADSLWGSLGSIERKVFNSNQSITVVAQIFWNKEYTVEIEQVNISGKHKDKLVEFITNHFPVFERKNYHSSYRPMRTGNILLKFTRIK